GLAGDPTAHLPDLIRVVLDPARPREVLVELAVGAPDDSSIAVEDQAGRPRGALVDRQDHLLAACCMLAPRSGGRLAPSPRRAGGVEELAGSVGEAGGGSA